MAWHHVGIMDVSWRHGGLYGNRTQTCNLPAALGRGGCKTLGAGARCNPYIYPYMLYLSAYQFFSIFPCYSGLTSHAAFMHLFEFIFICFVCYWYTRIHHGTQTLVIVPTAFWLHGTDVWTEEAAGFLGRWVVTHLPSWETVWTNKSRNTGFQPKNPKDENYVKIILQPRLQQQSCVDIVKAIKLMLQRGLVPESWTQRYWKDEDIGNVMSFDEEVFE